MADVLDLFRLLLLGATGFVVVQHVLAWGRTPNRGNLVAGIWTVAAALLLAGRHVQHVSDELVWALAGSRVQIVMALLFTPLTLVTVDILAGRSPSRLMRAVVGLSFLPPLLMAFTDVYVDGHRTTALTGAVHELGPAALSWLPQTVLVCVYSWKRLHEIVPMTAPKTWIAILCAVCLGLVNDLFVALGTLDGVLVGDLVLVSGILLSPVLFVLVPVRDLGQMEQSVEQGETRIAEAEAQLHSSQRLATVGLLAAGVAHEINNPLTTVLMTLKILQQQDADPARRELLDDAVLASNRIADVVRDLSTFARKPEEERASADPARVIALTVRMARHQVEHHARLVVDTEDTPPVRGDERRLGQVLLNLVVNALHAVSGGQGGRITLRSRTDGDSVVLEVEDDGPGIPPDVIDRVMDPFFTTKGVGEGSGLGLSICDNIVRDCGGTLELSSVPGQTIARLRLPVSEVDPALPAAPEATEDTPLYEVLVVDDDEQLRRMFGRVLAPHRVTVVGSGVEALEWLADHEPHVVVCDLMLPGMSGAELYALVGERYPELRGRFVFVSGGTFGTDEAVGNWHEVIPKPFSRQQLMQAVAARAGYQRRERRNSA